MWNLQLSLLVSATIVCAVYSNPVVIDQEAEAQNFFPSIYRDGPITIQGHSRPFLSAYTRGLRGTSEGSPAVNSILGSGDLGVLRGGTFYQDDDKQYASRPDLYGSFYSPSSNGHSGPYLDGYYGGFRHDEQFANFRDFADFNAPADAAYSQYVVLYANPGSVTQNQENHSPKNIIEQLASLDEETPKKKLSLGKRKLALETKSRKKSGKSDDDKRKEIATEPLLALS
ncbi:uncharacterized protein LOC113389123 [Ctenocephalides felis]|uniref:uncharacterized protein LOC113389123 n=1 Tax=Ctenocephalides felis TaxID=7515 RepID=UPI000E6E4992|nr:uncharacterized protein LOC113389123 [Ctenocephalides felis]